MSSTHTIEQLYATILSRKDSDETASYVASLLKKTVSHVAKKVGEEAVETAIAAACNDRAQTIYESADLLFHLSVLWAKMDITPAQIWQELQRREGISGLDEKRERIS